MRCPKCQYISFDSSDRCRNCGYEFALTVDAQSLDLPIQTGDEAIGPFSDFKLTDPDARLSDASLMQGAPAGDAAAAAGSQARPITSSFDLPLFRDRSAGGDAPLVAPPAAPRPPLSVRRSNPVATRSPARIHVDEPELDLDAAAPIERAPAAAAAPNAVAKPDGAVPVGLRIIAALLDTAILGAIALAILYLTLKVCGLGFADTAVIPAAPFGSFLLLIAGGYFTLFIAASGQTIGKMATGLKVVSADAATLRVPLGHAVVRAAAYLVSALPAGLGFLPALLAADGRAIHDRLAATRVVKA
jgi:uncharacterized RDD family membrane protein YckC